VHRPATGALSEIAASLCITDRAVGEVLALPAGDPIF
jgi:hypothetical protein